MSPSSLKQFHDTDKTRPLLRQLDESLILRQMGLPEAASPEDSINALRLAAATSSAELFESLSVGEWIRTTADASGPSIEMAAWCFKCLDGYLDAIISCRQQPDSIDILYFCASGLVSSRPHEVKNSLQEFAPSEWLQEASDQIPADRWAERVRQQITVSVIALVKQQSRADIEFAGSLLRELAGMQEAFEREWLHSQALQSEQSLRLLAVYHAAEAVLRLSEFLLAGAVETDGRLISDIQPELRRLLSRAEEFLAVARAAEDTQWLKAVSIVLTKLRSSSIWVQARGISNRIDAFIESLVQGGRAHQVFSLLPSQQDALRQSLLDPSRIAIVLQMPTSAGKTLLAEFAILQTLDAFPEHPRVVYVVPTRALATQARRTLSRDLGPIGVRCSAAGSAFEEDPFELQLLSDHDGIVVATPEKLDLLLRAHPDWFAKVRLIIVDEAHLLGEGERGARLELLLANLRREAPEARQLLLTPFIDNGEAIARWLSPERGHSVAVQWRPSDVLLGMADLSGKRGKWCFDINLENPYQSGISDLRISVPTTLRKKDLGTTRDRIRFLASKFSHLGVVLSLFSASPSDAEKSARERAEDAQPLHSADLPPNVSLAVALARHEYGSESDLAYCLSRGTAFHHSSVSPILRYLIEDCVRDGAVRYVAATSTLAQGMNFPVATILVHSVHKPYGGGDMSGSEFWNLAGRAGRVGLVDRGFVVFVNEKHSEKVTRYAAAPANRLASALLAVIPKIDPQRPLKEQYREIPELRPFIQYLAHAAASQSPERAIANLEELIQQSFANESAASDQERRVLRNVGRSYLQQLLSASGGMIKAADQTGLSTFSFNELYAKVRSSTLLQQGPASVQSQGVDGYAELVEALRWVPELSLAIGHGSGDMDVLAVARVVEQWVGGMQIYEMAEEFPGKSHADRLRNAARYLHGTVSQTLSWGTHAYLRSWMFSRESSESDASGDRMLPAYIQYGVNTPEAAVASLLGVPRSFATAFGDLYREQYGPLTPENVSEFRAFAESAESEVWNQVVERAGIQGVRAEHIHAVMSELQGV